MLCSPSTQRMPSATFDLPLPFGPTIAVMPGLNSSTVRGAKLLKPCSSRRLRYTRVCSLLAEPCVTDDHGACSIPCNGGKDRDLGCQVACLGYRSREAYVF